MELGIKPLYSYIGKSDIFDRSFRATQINMIDALAASAVFVMGEGAEQTPIALVEEASKVEFLSHPPTQEEEKMMRISLEEDIYAPLLESVGWIWNKR